LVEVAAGSATVVKLATETARINAPFTEIVARASRLPPGVVNVLTTG
jgi:acyl-CoA reductase-like NAD-dependent aldehyde dehydrogenase